MKILAVITARGGSKRIPRKNVRPLQGRPLIDWTISPALECRDLLHDLVISTDDEEIARVAAACGGSVPFRRPPELALDTAKSLPVVQHAVAFIEARDQLRFDWILLLQPTSPFRTGGDIRTAVALAQSDGCDSVVSVTEAALHPVFAKRIDNNGLIYPFILEEPEGLRKQDVSPPAYMRNGAIYLTARDVVMEQNSLYGKRIRAYVMPPERSLDVDTPLDWRVAEVLAADLAAGGEV